MRYDSREYSMTPGAIYQRRKYKEVEHDGRHNPPPEESYKHCGVCGKRQRKDHNCKGAKNDRH